MEWMERKEEKQAAARPLSTLLATRLEECTGQSERMSGVRPRLAHALIDSYCSQREEHQQGEEIRGHQCEGGESRRA